MKKLHQIILSAGLLFAASLAANATSQTYLQGELSQESTAEPGSFLELYNGGIEQGSVVSDTLNWTGACSVCNGYAVSGSGAAKVINGTMGAQASITVSGTVPTSSYLANAIAESSYVESLTISGGSGSGVLSMQYTLDGSFSSTGAGFNSSSVDFGVQLAPSGSYMSLNGAALTSGSTNAISGNGAHSDTLTVLMPFTYGTAFEIIPFMQANAYFQVGGGNTTPYTSSANFYNTMTLDAALVYTGTPTALGSQNLLADISSGTGLDYGPHGIAGVPLPATAWLLLSGVGGLLTFSRRRARIAA